MMRSHGTHAAILHWPLAWLLAVSLASGAKQLPATVPGAPDATDVVSSAKRGGEATSWAFVPGADSFGEEALLDLQLQGNDSCPVD